MAGTVSMTGLVSNTNWKNLIDDMMNAERAATENPLTDSKNTYQSKLSAWQALNTKLAALTDYIDSNKINKNGGYAVYTSSLSSTDSSIIASNVLGASIGNVSGPGSYSIEISQLAQSEKLSSDIFSSNTTALGVSGDILVNNKVVNLSATDTLNNVASRINNANAGVTATVLAISGTQYKLLLESASTGAAGISLKNGSASTVLESLNLHTATTQLAHASGLDALSDTYGDATSAVGTLLGLTVGESGTIQIKGTDSNLYGVNIDLSTDSLDGIASKINTANGGAAIPGVTASVEEVTENGKTRYQLKLTNVDVTDLQDDKNILGTLGVVENTVKNSLKSGLDASFKIDNNQMSSASNTIASAITGVTLNLTGTNVGKPVTLSITQNNGQIATNASTLVTAINNVISNINTQNTYTGSSTSNSTDKSAQNPLFGDNTLTLIKGSISSAVFATVSGNSVYTNASSIGVTYGKDGTISVDSAKLSTALATNSSETINVMKTLGDNLYNSLHGYVDPITGTLVSMTRSIQERMTGIDKKIADLEARYARERTVLETRFNALELLIQQSNATKSWLTQQTTIMQNTKS